LEEDFICAVDDAGNVIPVPNECFADCFELTVIDSADCLDDPGLDFFLDFIWSDCGCDPADLESEGICIEVSFGDSLVTSTGTVILENETFETWVPSECFADCWGFSDFTIIDCDSIEWEWNECDSIWNDEWDDEWDDPYGCDCDESAWDGEGICIEVTGEDSLLTASGEIVLDSFEFVTWVPSECYADCWGFDDYTIIDCDDEWDDEWDDPFDCDCDEDDWDGEGICIELVGFDSIITAAGSIIGDTLSYITWVPSECFADCWGFVDYVLVDCDSIWNDEWDDGWDDPYNCDCDESAWDGEGICIEIIGEDSLLTSTGEIVLDSFEYVTWVPSECYADCWGYDDYTIVDCDEIIDDTEWDDCDCEYALDDEPVCVLTNTATGEICPFPNMCYAECAGYDSTDVVDCEEVFDFYCLECLEEEIDPVCVTDSTGQIFPVPNLCFAECLGFDVIDDEDCGGFIDGTIEDEDLSLVLPVIHELQAVDDEDINGFKMYPNPATDYAILELDLKYAKEFTLIVSDVNNRQLINEKHKLNSGYNRIQLDVSTLIDGMYFINVYGTSHNLTKSFIKH
jgi:hypothetical protein